MLCFVVCQRISNKHWEIKSFDVLSHDYARREVPKNVIIMRCHVQTTGMFFPKTRNTHARAHTNTQTCTHARHTHTASIHRTHTNVHTTHNPHIQASTFITTSNLEQFMRMN